MPFFKKLSTINPEFYIALHFCNPKYREKIAALLCLCHQWHTIAVKTSEPILLQIRLKWWYEQYDLYYATNKSLPINAPPELALLIAYDLRPFIIAFENFYINRDYDKYCIMYQHIFQIIEKEIDIKGYSENIKLYGKLYGQLNQEINQEKMSKIPFYPLPFSFRFLRIPLILKLKKSKIFTLFSLMVNFLR
jgi:hypothetical protein